MVKKGFILGITAILTGALLCGCSGKNVAVSEPDSEVYVVIGDENGSDEHSDQDANSPTFSKDYIAGIDYGGKPFWYDEIYEKVSATLIYTTDKKIEVYMGQSLYGEHDTLIDTVPLSDDRYLLIEKAIDQKELYSLDPGSDENLMDGFYKYIFLYDENNELLKEVGAYEPTNRDFLDAYGVLQQSVPYEEIHEIMEKQKQVMRYNDCLADIGKLTEDKLIASEAEKIITPFNMGEMVESEDWTDDTQKCFRVKIITKDDHRLTKDYFFYQEDENTVIPIAVDYPSSEEVGACRYFENNWGENKARFEDVTFDGHEDLLISLDGEEGNKNTVFCAYVYDNGEFIYNPSFEKITNYKVDSKNSVISGVVHNGKTINKKYSYDEESKTFIEIK